MSLEFSSSAPCYVYGFVLSAAETAINGFGLDANSPLHCIQEREITAVISTVDTSQFTGATGDKNLNDINWVGPRALAHQQVAEQLGHHSPVLPTRFGTMFSSCARLHSFLTKEYAAILQFLNQVDGKEEWALKGFCQRQTICKQLRDQALQAKQAEFAGLTPGLRYFKEKKLEQAAEQEFTNWLAATIEAIAADLRPLCDAMVECGTQSAQLADRKDDLVMNWSVLIDKNQLSEFKRQLDILNERFQVQGLSLESSGPWPPYSFCPAFTLEV